MLCWKNKEWLLKEIHHRVKNNLQIVMSLLNSQAAYRHDSKTLSAIHESQHRVHTISLIHQKLYQKVALVEMASYIRELTEYLSDSFHIHSRIEFKLAVVPLDLDVTIAVPLGLLINEAVTNCLKYAFPAGRAGTVCISIRQEAGESYLLSIADDGMGLQPDFDPAVNRTLGTNLIRGLTKQLGGDRKIESLAGLTMFMTMTGLSREHFQLLYDEHLLEGPGLYNGEVFKEACRNNPHRQLRAKTFKAASHLMLPMQMTREGKFILSFYSREPEAYLPEHQGLLQRLEKPLTLDRLMALEEIEKLSEQLPQEKHYLEEEVNYVWFADHPGKA
jgi:two-component sensor histidine kinase